MGEEALPELCAATVDPELGEDAHGIVEHARYQVGTQDVQSRTHLADRLDAPQVAAPIRGAPPRMGQWLWPPEPRPSVAPPSGRLTTTGLFMFAAPRACGWTNVE